MKERLLEIINQKSYTPKTKEEFEELLNTTDILFHLNELLDDGIIYEKKGKYYSYEKRGVFKGVLELKDKGFGFIKSPLFEEDFFVSSSNLLDAHNKDEVLFTIKKVNYSKKQEAEVFKVIKRNNFNFIGEVFFYKGKKYLDPFDKTFQGQIELIKNNYQNGDYVKCEAIEYFDRNVRCKVVKKLGSRNEFGEDILRVLYKYDFENSFDDEVLKEAKLLKNTDNSREIIKKDIITIDGSDALDLDDAISVEKNEDGTYSLGVYIADVSYYVKEGSFLDKEAYKRGTSVYLTSKVVPMLPFELSNDLCSLNENTEKLVLALDIKIDKTGKVLSSSIKEAKIETLYRMNYSDTSKILEGDEDLSLKYKKIVPMLKNAKELRDILYEKRVKRGSLNFETKEAKIIVDNEGRCIDVSMRERLDSESIIEEFMILANETVAEMVTAFDLPFLYRVHDKPSADKVKKLSLVINSILKEDNKKSKMNITRIHKILSLCSSNSAINNLLLRLMSKAVYSPLNIGHYGLASNCYTHFTSPIRRYPDLVVHRLLKQYIIKSDINVDYESLEKKLFEIGRQTSKKERDAMECEFEVNDMKKAEYMEGLIGKIFTGNITSIQKFGFFVELENTVEGLVKSGNFFKYSFNEGSLKVKCERNHKEYLYSLGDEVKIIVINASKKKKEIDFDIVDSDKHKRNNYGQKRKHTKK